MLSCVFIFQKYGKFWSILLGHFIKHKHLISEECQSTVLLLHSKIICAKNRKNIQNISKIFFKIIICFDIPQAEFFQINFWYIFWRISCTIIEAVCAKLLSLISDILGLICTFWLHDCSITTMHSISLGEQNGRVQQLVLGHESLLSSKALSLSGPGQSPTSHEICHFFWTQKIDVPHWDRSFLAFYKRQVEYLQMKKKCYKILIELTHYLWTHK